MYNPDPFVHSFVCCIFIEYLPRARAFSSEPNRHGLCPSNLGEGDS